MILPEGSEKQIGIDRNKIAAADSAPIVVECEGERIDAGEIRIKGESEVLYSLHQPQERNHRVWLTTTAEVELFHVESD